jgi:hypothetical protein
MALKHKTQIPRHPAHGRDVRIDFFRGLALFAIFIDHVPGDYLSHFTFQAWAFSDAAEVFVFLAGYSAALVYGRIMDSQGFTSALARISKRVWQLYTAHLILFLLFTSETSFSLVYFKTRVFADEFRLYDFMTDPAHFLLQVLVLRFQPTFMDILPLYIVLLLLFPLVLLGMRKSLCGTVACSAAVYLLVQAFDIGMPAYPVGQVWFFDPLAWQFLFVLGAATSAFGRTYSATPFVRRVSRGCFLAALLVVGACVAAHDWEISGFAHYLPDPIVKTLGSSNKTMLAPLRLLNFLALAVVVARVSSRSAGFWDWWIAKRVRACGQNSLEVFCLGVLLSVWGYFAFAILGPSFAMQVFVNAVGIGLLASVGPLLGLWERLAKPADADRRGVPEIRAGLDQRTNPWTLGTTDARPAGDKTRASPGLVPECVGDLNGAKVHQQDDERILVS